MFDDKEKLGMISEGVNAWNKLVTTEGRIHHHCSVSLTHLDVLIGNQT